MVLPYAGSSSCSTAPHSKTDLLRNLEASLYVLSMRSRKIGGVGIQRVFAKARKSSFEEYRCTIIFTLSCSCLKHLSTFTLHPTSVCCGRCHALVDVPCEWQTTCTVSPTHQYPRSPSTTDTLDNIASAWPRTAGILVRI